MAKTKKEIFPVLTLEGNEVTFNTEVIDIPTPIAKLSVDYPSEGLNNIAKKINEIIDHLDGKN